MMTIGSTSLGNLAKLRHDVRRERVSSWNKKGDNQDHLILEPYEARTIYNVEGAGCIKHVWMTLASVEEYYARKVALRMWWDNEEEAVPSVEVPIGDFFGIGHGIVKNFWSLPLTMSPRQGKGFNCYFPMPFSKHARIAVTNETESKLTLYFYVDYEAYPQLGDDYGRFHVQWRRENPTVGWEDPGRSANGGIGEVFAVPNLTDEANYVILEAHGKGHYVGCYLDVDCFSRQKNDWYGEGDDMIVIDDEPRPPRLHGTGTEDYFNAAYSPQEEFNTPYHGLTVYSGTEEWPWRGKNSSYRFHIEDPVFFEKSIRVSIEHGHANNLSNDYASTAYWYQTEPHLPFPFLPFQELLSACLGRITEKAMRTLD